MVDKVSHRIKLEQEKYLVKEIILKNRQDGVVAQCSVERLESLTSKSGRTFILTNVTTKGFVKSHSISNYGWIFERQNGLPGYVIPK